MTPAIDRPPDRRIWVSLVKANMAAQVDSPQ
jgi:hypothetical protein